MSTSYGLSRGAFSVTVSPTRLVVGPDDLGSTQLLTVVNRGTQPVALTVQRRNFTTSPDGGLSYRSDAAHGAADWVSVSPDQVRLAPGQSRQVRATITVPANPDVGDHQLALVFLAAAGKTSGNIRVNRGVGVPTYLTVPGAVDDSVRLDGLSGPRWSWRGRPTLTASLTSTGTVHRDFRGPTALDVGTPGHLGRFGDLTVSRGAARDVSTSWDDAPLLCVCHPSMTVVNRGGVAQTVSTRVVVLPWWMLAGLAVVVLGASAVAVVARRRRRGPVPSATSPAPEPGDLAAAVSRGDG